MICMGREVVLVLGSGREIQPPIRNGLLHDSSGSYWPPCSLLIAKFAQGKRRSDDGEARDYFGKKTRVFEGEVALPPVGRTKWHRVGEVEEVFYDRAGSKAPGYFHHRFHKPRGLWRLLFLFKPGAAKGPVVLYKWTNAYRLELPDGCIVDDRGIALP